MMAENSPWTICPDGGKCHHNCNSSKGCFRVATCGPLSGLYPGDEWPASVTASNLMRPVREKIASIINPTAWELGQVEDDRWDFERDKARRKADEIMRLEVSNVEESVNPFAETVNKFAYDLAKLKDDKLREAWESGKCPQCSTQLTQVRDLVLLDIPITMHFRTNDPGSMRYEFVICCLTCIEVQRENIRIRQESH